MLGKNKKDNKNTNNTTPEVTKGKRTLVVFHKNVQDGCFYDVEPRVSVDVDTIKTIDTSSRDGSTLIITNSGVIAVKESFEEANRIWANA